MIIEAIGFLLATDTAFLIALLIYLSTKYQQYIIERRNSLDKKLNAVMNETRTTEITIQTFLPLFKEHEKIEDWTKKPKQILMYLAFSMVCACGGLLTCLPDYNITIEGFPVEAIFVIGAVLYFLWGLAILLIHANEVYEWKISQKEEKQRNGTTNKERTNISSIPLLFSPLYF